MDDAIFLNSFYAIVEPVGTGLPTALQTQGFCWKFDGELETYFADNILCFRFSYVPSIFNRKSTVIAHMVHREGHSVVVYLDEVLCIAVTEILCAVKQQRLIFILGQLGLSVTWENVVAPTTGMRFLGYVLDSGTQSVEIPEEKAATLRFLASRRASPQKIAKRQLQVLV